MKKITTILSLAASAFLMVSCAGTGKISAECGHPIAYASIISSGESNIDKALEYLVSHDVSNLECGRYSIDGENIYMTVSENTLRSPADAKLEAHRKYADIQIVLNGSERFGLSDTQKCERVSIPYSTANDIVFYADAPSRYCVLNAGQMIILPPEIAHMPLLGEGKVRKCVVKVLVAK